MRSLSTPPRAPGEARAASRAGSRARLRRLSWTMMLAGGLGTVAVLLWTLAFSPAASTGRRTAAAASPTAGARIAAGSAARTSSPVLDIRPRLVAGSVIAHLRVGATGPSFDVVEGLDTGPGELGHDAHTAYPGELHTVLLVARGDGVAPGARPGDVLDLTTGYGDYRYRTVAVDHVAGGAPLDDDSPDLRLAVPAASGFSVARAELLPSDAASAAQIGEEVAVADAERSVLAAGVTAGAPGGRLRWPCTGPITQGFGPVDLALEFPFVYQGVAYPHFHTGLDIAVVQGTPVGAAAAGVVVLATTTVVDGRTAGYGTYVLVSHGGGTYTLYGHLSRLAVKVGDAVAAGQVIGLSGSTGNSTGPHLHFEVRQGTEPVDPMPLLQS